MPGVESKVNPFLYNFSSKWKIRKGQPWKYCIGWNFRGSLILWIFNCSRMKHFDMRHTVSHSDCKSINGPYPRAKLLNSRETLYLWSSHCFADSCELEWTTVCMLDKYATPIVYYMCVQWICGTISMKSSNIPIRENVDPWRFSAVWYSPHPLNHKCPSH